MPARYNALQGDRSRPSRNACALIAALATGSPALAQVTLHNTTFLDRGATNEIILGNMRGGMAILDYDSDGYMDLVFETLQGQINRLFHNIPNPSGGRTYADVSTGSGLDDAAGLPFYTGFGVSTGDYDNDGDPDILFIGVDTSTGAVAQLYRNDGDGGGGGAPHFTDVSIPSGIRWHGDQPDACTMVDYDLDGWLDIFITGGSGFARQYRLLHNQRNGTFADTTAILPITEPFGVTYTASWHDFDSDGYPDCFIPTAGLHPVILHNRDDGAGGRTFTDVALAHNFDLLGPAPMGIAFGDYDNDLDFDLAITDAANGTYFRNDNGLYTQIEPMNSIFGWGVMWIDADNDGRLDNYQAGSLPNANFDKLFHNNGDGTFTDISPALNGVFTAAQYAVQVDYDNDGRSDIITLNPNKFVSIYENRSDNPNHWITLKLTGDGERINRDAIGAVIRLLAGGKTQIRQISSGSSTSSTEDLRPHFGLGSETTIDRIEILWPRRGTLAARTDTYTGPFPADQILPISPHCIADHDDSGFVDTDDFDAFVYAFEAGDPGADADGSGFIDTDDFDAFIHAFEAGC
ncbi:MAG: CRTAC1 family protein [Phycisphaerales bacterium]|nr:CRTAC1 family protein [Phycisphaerales bacterium]